MKTITVEREWAVIAQMGWSKKANSSAMAKEWWGKLRKSEMEALSSFVSARVCDLYFAVANYENTHSTQLEVGSDDGFSDLWYHVVGLGQAEFDAAMKNPLLLQERYRKGDYKESFAYVFQKPDQPRTNEEKQKALLDLLNQVEVINKEMAQIRNQIDILSERVNGLARCANQVKEDLKETA